MTIIKLEKTFVGEGEVKGFSFDRLLDGEFMYLYKVVSEKKSWYEVIKRFATPIIIDFDKKIVDENTLRERYPKAKDFGSLAWSYKNLEEAIKKYNKLENDYSSKQVQTQADG